MAYAREDPKITCLFRYRDLIDETLLRHEEVIEQEGACWWGWWRRPHEDSRDDIWTALSAANPDQPITVGLFDSGAREGHRSIRRASVIGVIPPTRNNEGQPMRPSVPANENHLIPAYYRASPFSRAWLKLKKIDRQPLNFFGKYRYASAPRLPGIAEAVLNSLVNKMIVDADELRMMDTTIWHVLFNPGDLGPRFLAPSLRVREPVTAEPLLLQGDSILHLSDMHYSTRPGKHAWDSSWSLAAALNSALVEHREKTGRRSAVGALVLTGDFTSIGDRKEFKQAAVAINSVMGNLGLGSDHVVVVPGNHDIQWSKPKLEKYNSKGLPVQAPAKARRNYVFFYKELLGHSPNRDLSMGRRFVLPGGYLVDVCGLNSSSLETGRKYLAGMGRVTPGAFATVRASLGWRCDERSHALRVVALHHHVTNTEDVEDPREYYTGFGMAVDAKQILRDAAGCGVQLLLHGHRHRQFVWGSDVYNLPEFTNGRWKLGRVAILGAGSAGSTDVDPRAHFFNLITINGGSLIVEMFKSTNCSEFKCVSTWTADCAIGPDGFSLGDWNWVTPEG